MPQELAQRAPYHLRQATAAPSRAKRDHASTDSERSGVDIRDYAVGQGSSSVQLKALDRALLQFRAAVDSRRGDDVHATARAGIQGGGSRLPHLATIQKSFGRHDVSATRAYVGPEADRATHALGAHAYATEGSVVLGQSGTDLHTVAHEAAHVVQQRAGVALKGGVGESGDVYERHADAVADRVVRGQSAEALLDTMAPRSIEGAGAGGVQLKEKEGGGLSPKEKVALLRQALRFCTGIEPLINAIKVFELDVKTGVIGLRLSASKGAGVGGGAGIDFCAFIDLESFDIVGDIFPFAQAGWGVGGGGSAAVVIGLHFVPANKHADPKGAYAGGSVGGSIKALGGVGFSVGNGLKATPPKEGWITADFSLGAEASTSVSASYAVSLSKVRGAVQSTFGSGIKAITNGGGRYYRMTDEECADPNMPKILCGN